MVVVYPAHTSHSFPMRGQRGCGTCCEWPQGKASQLGWNAGTEALCRPGSGRALGAVMSAGGEIKIGKQHGTGRAFRRSTAAIHTVQQRHADMAYNIFMLARRELDTVNTTVSPGVPVSSSRFWMSVTICLLRNRIVYCPVYSQLPQMDLKFSGCMHPGMGGFSLG